MNDDAKTPPIHERLLWVVVACLAWRCAGLAASVGIYRAGAAGVALVVLATGVGLGSLVVATSRRVSRWATGPHLFVAFTFFFLVFGLVDSFMRAHTAYTWSTDAHVFGDYAARLLAHGKNPYEHSLSGGFAVARMPIELQTPLVDGGFSDRLAYPSLSFLVLVPFVKLGIDTRLAFATAVWGCTAVVYFNVPRAARPIVLVPFFADPTYLYFAFGGVTDGVWALLLCFAIIHWQRRDRAALLFGLACCMKQHPWLLAPFIAARLWQETKGDRRVVFRFFGLAAAIFALVNLPFIVWSPMAWVQGVVEPLVRRMVPLGDGPTGFVALAGAPVPKVIFVLAFWGSMVLLFFACLRLRAGRVLLWVAPSLAFFLNHRSLSTYWYFNVFPFAIELARTDWNELLGEPDDREGLRRLGLAGAAGAAVLFIAGIVTARSNAGGLEVELELPFRTWMGRMTRADLKVTNRSSHVVKPRFWGQSVSFQPLTWRIDEGPIEIAPGETQHYSIAATHTIAEIEVDRGGTLTVTDQESAMRRSIPIDSDPGALSPRAVPNADFRFWDIKTGSPTFWNVARSGAPAGRVRPTLIDGRRGVELVVDTDVEWARKNELQYCPLIPSCWAASKASSLSAADLHPAALHRVELVLDLVSREPPISIWVRPPAGVNRAPSFEDVYGVQLTFADQDVMLLVGGDAGTGKLPEGIPYETIAAPPETWSKISIDFAGLRKKYASDAYPRVHPTTRLPLLELPFIGLQLRYVLSTRSAESKRAAFGPVEDPIAGRDDRNELMADLAEHPGQVDLWRGNYEWDFGNAGRAEDYFERARRQESHPEIELRYAALARYMHKDAEAKKAFENALAGRPVKAHIGLGWIAMSERKHEESRQHFQAVLDLLAAKTRTDGEDELHRLNALVGVGIARAALGDCKGGLEAIRQLPERDQNHHLTRGAVELVDCAKRER